MFKIVFSSAIALLLTVDAARADSIGFRMTSVNPGGTRPLNVALWYPTNDPGTAKIVGENRVFYGISALENSTPKAGLFPLVVLSHGDGGSWRNLSWLAGELVNAGYVVVAPDHPGTTTFNRDPAQSATLWERPRDLSRSIDAVLADATLAGQIDPDRIAAIGHSLGGWTVAALAGARFDPAQFARDCRDNRILRACALSAGLGLDRPEISQNMHDPRIRAFVSLDLGLARGFTPESLAQVNAPGLIFGAGVDVEDMPADLESGWLAEHLPAQTSQLVIIPEAMHFSFMQLCKPGAEEILEGEMPGDGILCRDGGDRPRAVIHEEIATTVIGFLSKALLVQ